MTTDKFIFFWGGTYSQWCPSPFTIDGVEFNCAEQYMMAKKALLFNDMISYDEIMSTKKPMTQKAIGRRVKGFDKEKWEAVCRDYVYEANLAKFNQNPAMKEELLATGSLEIVEASPEDTIWGIGMHETHKDILDKTKWKGTNWLGEAIMKVRETFNQEVEPTTNVALTDKDVSVILALIDFVKSGPIGLEAIEDYNGIDNETVWEDVKNLENKL